MQSVQMEAMNFALRKQGILFDPGLTTTELQESESRYDLRFPPDLAEFLSLGLPVSKGFPNWRTGIIERPNDVIPIAEQMKWPTVSICFDVEHDNFWMKEWGARPEDPRLALELTRQKIKEPPVLIPVFQQRFLPAEPLVEGNPVLSVWQTDIICYGLDLPSYIANEFHLPLPIRANGSKSPRRIRFWSDIIEKVETEFERERGDL